MKLRPVENCQVTAVRIDFFTPSTRETTKGENGVAVSDIVPKPGRGMRGFMGGFNCLASTNDRKMREKKTRCVNRHV